MPKTPALIFVISTHFRSMLVNFFFLEKPKLPQDRLKDEYHSTNYGRGKKATKRIEKVPVEGGGGWKGDE